MVALTDAAGAVVRVAEHPKKWIDAVAAGPGGAIAYAIGKQAHVRLGDGTTRTFEHERAATALAFAPKGMRLGVARYGGISLWWPNTDAGAVDARVEGLAHRDHVSRPTAAMSSRQCRRTPCTGGGFPTGAGTCA